MQSYCGTINPWNIKQKKIDFNSQIFFIVEYILISSFSVAQETVRPWWLHRKYLSVHSVLERSILCMLPHLSFSAWHLLAVAWLESACETAAFPVPPHCLADPVWCPPRSWAPPGHGGWSLGTTCLLRCRKSWDSRERSIWERRPCLGRREAASDRSHPGQQYPTAPSWLADRQQIH